LMYALVAFQGYALGRESRNPVMYCMRKGSPPPSWLLCAPGSTARHGKGVAPGGCGPATPAAADQPRHSSMLRSLPSPQATHRHPTPCPVLLCSKPSHVPASPPVPLVENALQGVTCLTSLGSRRHGMGIAHAWERCNSPPGQCTRMGEVLLPPRAVHTHGRGAAPPPRAVHTHGRGAAPRAPSTSVSPARRCSAACIVSHVPHANTCPRGAPWAARIVIF
jgi:hypothetical protein